MPDIRNDKELENFLEILIFNVFDVVTEKLMTMLHNRIDEDTYKQKSSNFRTGEFKEAFQWSDMKKEVRKYVQALWYDHSNMTCDYESYGIHSSVTRQDVRRFMNKILNVEGLTSPIGAIVREPYWDNFTDEVDKRVFWMILIELEKLGIINNFTVKVGF